MRWRVVSNLIFLLCVAFFATAAGCSLLDMKKSTDTANFFDNAENKLAIPESTVSTVDLEVVIIHRPIGDPLIGSQLWSEVDQIGALDVEVRKKLATNGIRVGQVGSSYPLALEELLGLSTEQKSLFDENNKRNLPIQKFSLRSGAEATITTGFPREIKEVRLPSLQGDSTKSFDNNARCIFRVIPRRTQEGWITLEVQPEIHHGEMAMRSHGHTNGWEQKRSQQIVPIFSQRFELDMNVGDIALLTSEGDDESSIGQKFFHSKQEAGDMQRLILIRLADVKKSGAVIKSARVVK